MDNRVEFQLQSEDDEATVDELIKFFSPVAVAHIWKEEEKAAKAWTNVITIVLTMVGEWAGEWAAQRYVLDPLADKAEEWIEGVRSAWAQSKSRRSFNITVKFGQDADSFEVQVSDASDQEVLRHIWKHIGQAHRVARRAQKQGMPLEKIRILPSGTQGLLVIGYEGNRPKHTINLVDGSISRIPAGSSDPEQQLWLIEQLIRRLEYSRMRVAMGYNVPEDEILRVEREIADQSTNLIPR